MSTITIDRALLEQALEALEAGLFDDPIFAGETELALRAALAAQGCYITQDITRQEYERLYPDAEEEVK